MIGTACFIVLTLIVAYFAYDKYRTIYKAIKLGRAYENDAPTSTKLKNMLMIAFGQKKMFKRPIPAILHLFIYIAFLFTQVELLEIIIDGVTGSHRFIGGLLTTSAPIVYLTIINSIEILSLLALIATFIFLIRRNIIKTPRLNFSDMIGWPKLDGNLILLGEIFLIFGIFLMNTSEAAMSYSHSQYSFLLSDSFKGVFHGISDATLHLMMKAGWWLHYIGILGFILYLPFSKHLHILLAFPNAYLTNESPKGYIPYMPEIFKEIQSMMNPEMAAQTTTEIQEIPTFGAKDVKDLSEKNLLDAFACTECGRCTSSCPAHITGKKLSPRNIMMKTRDRLEELMANFKKNNTWEETTNPLLHNYITAEELNACTTCNACVEECPVNISPLDIIVQLRRNIVMEESSAPAEWNNMFTTIETNGSPWKFAASDRADWSKETE